MLYPYISEQSYILYIYARMYEHMYHRDGTEKLGTHMASEMIFNATPWE